MEFIIIMYVGYISLITAAAHPINPSLHIDEDHGGIWLEDILEWEKSVSSLKPVFELDTAWVTVKSLLDFTLDIYWQHAECIECPLLKQGSVLAEGNYTLLLQTKYGNHINVTADLDAGEHRDFYCGVSKQYLKDRGDYWLIVEEDNNNNIQCHLVLANDPPNPHLPILWAFLIFTGLAIIWIVIKHMYRHGIFSRCRCGYHSQDFDNDAVEMSEKQSGVTSNGVNSGTDKPPAVEHKVKEQKVRGIRRLRSLDTFRGLSLIIMIFVNYGAGGYYFFQHAVWNGMTVGDLVFPWFVFIMGTSMAFSFRGMLKRETPRKWILWKICTRTLWLFAIGICYNTKYNSDMSVLRITGILQRLAASYFFVAIVHFFFAKTTDENKEKSWAVLRDVTDYWAEWLIMLCILALHFGLTLGLPIDDCPETGYLWPGGLHQEGKHINCTGGAAGYIDRLILTENHLYPGYDVKAIYHTTQAMDPEGILGTLPSIFTCFLGLQAGKIIMIYKGHRSRVIRWLVWAVICAGLTLLLNHGNRDNGWIPINKNFWSVSFTFGLSGMAFVLLAILYIPIDVIPLYTGAPLLYPGMNSIVIYICHSVFSDYFPVSWKMPDTTLHWQRLFMALWGSLFWVVVSYILYRKRIFVAL